MELAQKPAAKLRGIHLTDLQKAVVNLAFILHEYSHLLDDYKKHEDASMLIKTLYYIGGNADVANLIDSLKPKYGADPFGPIILHLMEIFYYDDDEEYPHQLFKSGMGTNNYVIAMNSLQFLYLNRMSLPVRLRKNSLPPEVPNEWVQKEQDLMDDMDDALTAEFEINRAQNAADLPLTPQQYTPVLNKGIQKLQALFEHAKTNPGAMVLYNQIKVSIENALQKVKIWSKNAVRETSQKSERKRSRSPSSGATGAQGPRRSERLRRGGLRKIKTVRRHTPNKHKKTKSRRG